MIIYIISFTEKGNSLSKKIEKKLYKCDVKNFYKKELKESLKIWTKEAFEKADGIIFIGAIGIAVRSIADFIKSKIDDPAVVVCDELGKFVIPILSGHIGGANELALSIARELKSVPVITTATDINEVWAVDNWAIENKIKINNIENIKYISSAMLRNEKIGLISDLKIDYDFPPNIERDNKATESGIVISPFIKSPFKYTLNLVPKCLAIGVGSRKNSNENSLIDLYESVLKKNKIDSYAVESVATINIKKEEKSILNLCKYIGLDLKIYTAQQLNEVNGEFNKSDFVKKITGTDNICERSCVKEIDSGEIIVKKTVGDGVTLAISMRKEWKKL